MRLNDGQKMAANCLDGNLLIIASAGTGKTTTIIERYLNLVENKGVLPDEIMMTTFTNKAAGDMIEKIKKRTDKISSSIGTMHSLFLKVLRDNSHKVFGKGSFTLLTDEKDRQKIIKGILKEQGIKDTNDAVKYFAGWISKYKNRAIFAEDLSLEGGIDEMRESGQITEVLDDELVTFNPLWRKKVNLVYKKYQNYLHLNSLLDFDEILMKTYWLFDKFPGVRETYRKRFKYIMVDEAQDLNLVQKRILDLISSDNVCFIGDDCQNIYEWRGSSNEVIFDFNELENSVFLEENYRSSKKIIDAVNSSISQMKHKIDKRLVATKNEGEEVYYQGHFQAYEEIDAVAGKIKELLEEGEDPEEIAVLFRTNIIGKSFEKEFVKSSIPCHMAKGVDFFEREEVKDIISLMRLKVNMDSFYDLERVSRMIPGFGKVSLERIKNFVHKNNLLLSNHSSFLMDIGLSAELSRALASFLDALKKDDLNEMLIDVGYYDYLDKKYSSFPARLEEKCENVDTLKILYKESGLSFLGFLDSVHEFDKNDDVSGKVVLSTIHSAKGLEWKHVFLVACNEGILPFYKDELSMVKRDSELRLFYVAISRAKEFLYISSHFTNKFRSYSPSHFLDFI